MSEHATELTRLRGMTLIAEDAQIRPAAMSYVKPSEYRYYAERAMQHMVDETTTHATAHATVQAERKIAEDQRDQVTKELEEAKREKLAWQQAAYVAGECVATTGPEGYYEMAPADWRDWLIADVQQQLATARADALQRRIEGGERAWKDREGDLWADTAFRDRDSLLDHYAPFIPGRFVADETQEGT